VIASAVLLRGGEANLQDVLSLLLVFGVAIVPGGLLFGLLLATVLLSRSTASGARWLSCSRWLFSVRASWSLRAWPGGTV